MLPTLTLTRDNLTPTLLEWGRVMGKEGPAILDEFGKRTHRQVLRITPPAHAGGATARAAFAAGRSKIDRQMNSVMAPRTLKRRRLITTVFGRPQNPAIAVITQERHPDVAGLYRQFLRYRNKGVGANVSSRGVIYFVDKRKFDAERDRRVARVGLLASGWSPGARGLGILSEVPAWVLRHGMARGSFKRVVKGYHTRITVSCDVATPRSSVRAELARRLPYAIRYATNGMKRNIAAMAAKTSPKPLRPAA